MIRPIFNVNLGPIKLSEIIDLLNCEIKGLNSNDYFSDFLSINSNKNDSDTITFMYEKSTVKKEINSGTTIVISNNEIDKFKHYEKLIIVNDVHEAVAKLSYMFYREVNDNDTDYILNGNIGDNCKIAKNAILKKGCILGDNVIVKDGVIIGNNCIIGNDCIIEENSIITHSILGDNIRIGRNSSIGQHGFGFAINNKKNLDILHLGRVIIQSNSSIGSNCCIDRGSFSDTVIGENTYFDNMCHIAHNVTVGRNCIFAAMCGIAGSTIIGENVIAGGQVGISGHITIGDNVQISAKSAVLKNVNSNSVLMGNPAINKFKYIRKYKKIYD